MKPILMLATLTLVSGTIQAEPQPMVGRADTMHSGDTTAPLPIAVSFDHQWTANGFDILDAEGKVVFSWSDDRAVYRDAMTVTFSPDSAHVVLMDHAPRAPMFFAAELRDGKWVNIPFHSYEMWGREVDDPRTPEYCRVTKARLLNWVSSIMLQIQMNQSSDNRAEPENPIRVEYVTSLQFQGNEVFFAAQ